MLKYEDDLKGSEFTKVEKFLNSKELKLILDKTGNYKKQKLIKLFQKHKIECDISKYIDAVLGNSDTVQIIEEIRRDSLGKQFKAFKKVI